MKDFIKFFSIITGLFRSIISILLLLSIGFVIFVDNNIVLAIFYLIVINNIGRGILKPLVLAILILAFVINTAISRNIFKAGENGKGHLANVFFGLVFLAIDAFLYFYLRDKLLYILIAFSGLIVINSLIGLIANFKGVYNTNIPEKKTEYVEVKTNVSEKEDSESPIRLDFGEAKDDKDEVNILKKDDTTIDGKTVIRTSQLIKEDTDLGTEAKDTDLTEERNKLINNKNSKKDSKETSKIEDTAKKDEETTLAAKEAEAKLKTNTPTTLKDVEEAKKDINKVVEDKGSKDKTYDPDLADEIKKKEEKKIYTKKNFVKDDN